MSADYRPVTLPLFPAVVNRSGGREPIAGEDQGDGTAAILITGSITTTPPVSSTVQQTTVAASTSAVELVAARATRLAMSVLNNGTGTLYIGFSGGVTSSNAGIVLQPGDVWTPPVNFIGAVYGVWNATGGNAIITEFTP